MPQAERVGEIRLDRSGGQVGLEAVQAVAEPLLRLAHHGGAADPAERVEGHRGPVPVRVADQARRQHPVVVAVGGQLAGRITLAGGDEVAERVARLLHQQVVPVVADGRGIAERVGEPVRQEEMPPRVVQLGGRVVIVAGGVEDPAGRQPPRLALPQVAGRPEHRRRRPGRRTGRRPGCR